MQKLVIIEKSGQKKTVEKFCNKRTEVFLNKLEFLHIKEKLRFIMSTQ